MFLEGRKGTRRQSRPHCLDQVTQEDCTQSANKQKGTYSPLGMSPICCKDAVRNMVAFP